MVGSGSGNESKSQNRISFTLFLFKKVKTLITIWPWIFPLVCYRVLKRVVEEPWLPACCILIWPAFPWTGRALKCKIKGPQRTEKKESGLSPRESRSLFIINVNNIISLLLFGALFASFYCQKTLSKFSELRKYISWQNLAKTVKIYYLLRIFFIWFRFHRDIRAQSCLCGVQKFLSISTFYT